MLAEKELAQTMEMSVVEKADKLEQLLLSDEEIAVLERLQIPQDIDSTTNQRWFANCGGCGGCRGCGGCGGCRPCRGCGGCGGCGCRGCRPCGGCRGCRLSPSETGLNMSKDTDDFEFGY